MAEHSSGCEPGCNDSHDYSDYSSVDHWGGCDHDGNSSHDSSNCFIATAVYGNLMAPEVVTLRQFRDQTLKQHWLGRKFIAAYYRVSPPIADWLRTKPTLSRLIRSLLDQFVRLVS